MRVRLCAPVRVTFHANRGRRIGSGAVRCCYHIYNRLYKRGMAGDSTECTANRVLKLKNEMCHGSDHWSATPPVHACQTVRAI
jgi:hypothetical protein